MRTKGQAAAFTWANKHDYPFNDRTVEERKAWRAGLPEAINELEDRRQRARDAAIARMMEVPLEEVSLVQSAAGGKVDMKKLVKGSLAEFEKEKALRIRLEKEKGWQDESPESLGSIQGSGAYSLAAQWPTP
jgi:hypothetical protein